MKGWLVVASALAFDLRGQRGARGDTPELLDVAYGAACMHPDLRVHFVRPNSLPADRFGAAR
jgi:hypothetical protein